MQGIAAGIETPKLFRDHHRRELRADAVRKKLTPLELPFYLGLMAHLGRHGIPSRTGDRPPWAWFSD